LTTERQRAHVWGTLNRAAEDRTPALAEKLGRRFEALGEYDGCVILEVPDESTVTTFVLAAITPGHLRATKATLLMRAGAVVEAMKKVSGMAFPKK
jgi:uncharacterized protein with GYD domain